MMKLIIAGAGPAGLATALAAKRWGMHVTLLERRPAPSNDGLFLTLAPNGLSVLRMLDVLGPLRMGAVVPTSTMIFTSTTGKRVGQLGACGPDRNPALTLMRSHLTRVLLDAVSEAGIRVEWGAAVMGVSNEAEGVRVETADGRAWDGDLVIGADGISSGVRKAMGGLPSARPSGMLSLGGVANVPGLAPTGSEFHMLWGRRAFFGHCVRAEGEAWWFANLSDDDPPSGRLSEVPAPVWLERLHSAFAGEPEPVGRILAAADKVDPWLVRDLPELPHWYRGRAVLIGDAAHAVVPSTGQGASLALEDAATLIGCLAQEKEVGRALQAFEAARRPRVEAIAAGGRRRSQYKAPRNGLERAVRDALMPLVFRFLVTDRSLAPVHGWRPGAPWPA